ncbi:MAG: 50S ribosomal protein L25, partial [Gammaproteobacteria bacterium]|nr:50S ribosomal protein L25 [Gammaproteobacteria bacterium]
MSEFDLVAESREDVGKGASRRLRRAGKVPGIVYGAGKNPAMIALIHTDLEKNLAQESFYSKVLNLKVGSKRKEKVVLKDIQRDPARPRVLHVDFQRVKATEALRMRVPLH